MGDKKDYKLDISTDDMKKVSIPELGQVVKTAIEGLYHVQEQAITGKQYIVNCPICGKPIHVMSAEPKVIKVMHKTCNAPIRITFVTETETKTETKYIPLLGSKTNAKLSWWTHTGHKQFILHEGKNFIGRKDDANPSHLSFKDEYASTRSICIEVKSTERGYIFHLTVLKAANPVKINKKEMPVGCSFDLIKGDIIEFGYPEDPIRLTFEHVGK